MLIHANTGSIHSWRAKNLWSSRPLYWHVFACNLHVSWLYLHVLACIWGPWRPQVFSPLYCMYCMYLHVFACILYVFVCILLVYTSSIQTNTNIHANTNRIQTQYVLYVWHVFVCIGFYCLYSMYFMYCMYCIVLNVLTYISMYCMYHMYCM